MPCRTLVRLSAAVLSAAGFAAAAMAAPPPGAQVTQAFPATGFRAVALQGSDDVTVAIGPFAVRATGDRAVIDQLRIVVEDGVLRIGRKPRATGRSDVRGHALVAVALPALAAVTVAGSGDMHVGAVRAPGLAATVSGSGDLALAGLEVARARFDVAGSGDLIAAGHTREGIYAVAGSGTIHAERLAAETLALTVAGSGDIDASARRTASVSLVGSGDVTVRGGAHCTISKAGSGSVTCG